ncbi:MAG TPA: DUF5309 family protein [Thermoanaerobaculia bacterium]|jgi:hypothetical protein|nr:DUF5309 family protein [Thermoanaerobaculia bacterium]
MAVQGTYSRGTGYADPYIANQVRDLETALNMVLWTDTPLQNIARVGPPPTARHSEWIVDAVTQPSAVSAVIEGGSIATSVTEAPTFLSNAIHHDREPFGVTNLDRIFPTAYGVTDTYSDQAARAFQRLAMRMDYNLLWSTYQSGTSGAEHKTSGLYEYVLTSGAGRNAGSAQTLAGASVPVAYSSFATNVAATLTALTATTNLRSFYEGGTSLDDCVCMCAPVMKPVFDAMLSTQTVSAATVVPLQRFTRPLDDNLVGATVDYVRTSWGTFVLLTNRWMAGGTLTANLTGTTYDLSGNGNQDIVIFNPDLYELRWAQAYEEYELAHTAASHLGYVEATCTPIYKNPKGFCILLDVN